MKWRLPGPQDPAQATSSPVNCPSALAAKAPASSWSIWTHSISLSLDGVGDAVKRVADVP